MPTKYNVKAKKKDGTIYEGIMTVKEPQLVNGLYSIARADGGWTYVHPDEISEIDFTPVVEETAKE
jgi:hypothetical protein